MNEKVTGLDWRDFVNLNTALDALQETYTKHAGNINSTSPEFWAKCVEEIKETRNKLNQNRAYDL